MSETATTLGRGLLDRLPPRLAPREHESPNRRLWRIETLVLLLVAAVLAVASFNDIGWSVDNDARLVADQVTWRAYTHRDFPSVSVGPLVIGEKEDTACGDATPGPPEERTQICLLVDGPAVHGLRTVIGGWRLAAQADDIPRTRYDCFGAGATKTLCPKG
jgi:hypothetical protein